MAWHGNSVKPETTTVVENWLKILFTEITGSHCCKICIAFVLQSAVRMKYSLAWK